jgi:hypothetical protein
MKVLFGCLMGVIAVVVVIILVAGYFGLMPVVSSLFGSDKPKDLGVTYTQADFQSAHTKSGIQRADLPASTPPAQSLVYSGQHAVNLNLTQQEITALLNLTPWEYWPYREVQVRFNPDGSAELSGIVEMDKMKDYALARGLSQSDIGVVMDKVNTFAVIQKDMPFYLKGTGSVVNGVVAFQADKLELGRVSIPTDQVNGREAELTQALQEAIARIPGFTCKNFSVSNGQIHFDGTVPNQVKRAVGGG